MGTDRELGGLGLTVEVGGLSAAVVDGEGRVRSRHTTQDDLRAAPIAQVAHELTRLAASGRTAADDLGLHLRSMCVAIPGDRDRRTGRLRFFPGLDWPDARTEDLLDPDLAASFPTPPLVVEEAHASAFAVLSALPGSSANGLLSISGTGAGLSAALVLDGTVHRGASGRTCEFGHIVVDPTGATCPCGGVGCLELTAGLPAIAHRASLGRPADQTTLIDALEARLRAGDRRAHSAVTLAGMHLGTALASVTRIVDPGRVVVGGPYARLLPWLDTTLRAALALHAPSSPLLVDDHITASPLAEAGALVGAAGIALATRTAAEPPAHEPDHVARLTGSSPAR